MADGVGSRMCAVTRPGASVTKTPDYSEMRTRTITWMAVACATLLCLVVPVNAQTLEAVGERALGMGGAFVAVANDSSATWWNPAGLADGPFFDLSIGHAVDDHHAEFPAGRHRTWGFSLGTPVIGASVYRLEFAEAAKGVPIGAAPASRQDGEALVGLGSWSGSSFGATIAQTLVDGVHAGATVKYVRGTFRTGTADFATSPEAALDEAGDLEGGKTEGQFDFDVGVLANLGAVRLGVLVRNVLAAEFAGGAFTLPRQARAGVAVSAEQLGGPSLTISADADLQAYATGEGMRRIIAVGAEQRLAGKRVGLRAGMRFNQVGQAERAVTAGASVAVRSGVYLEAHVVGGGSPAEQGWGTGVRVSF